MKGEQQQNGIMSVDGRLPRVNDCFSQYMAMEMGEALESKDHSEAGVTHSALNHEIPSTKGGRGGGKVELKEQHDGGSIERQGLSALLMPIERWRVCLLSKEVGEEGGWRRSQLFRKVLDKLVKHLPIHLAH